MVMLITRKAEFSASHACWKPEWTPEHNRAVYGAGASPLGHGHNYLLEVTLAGDPDPVTGMVVDLKHVKDVITRDVIEPFDHRHLNHEVPPFDVLVPTSENMAMEIWRRLEPHFPARDGVVQPGAARLHSIRLYETDDLCVEYFGDASECE